MAGLGACPESVEGVSPQYVTGRAGGKNPGPYSHPIQRLGQAYTMPVWHDRLNQHSRGYLKRGPMIARDAVLDALRDVYDPEIPVNIVDLGLIYGLELVDDDKVHVTMTMTFPGCPASAYLHEEVRMRVESLGGVDSVDVTVGWGPPWSPDMIAPPAKQMLGLD